MKSEKIDVNNSPKSDNLKDIIAEFENQPPKNSILLDKSLLPSKGKLYPEQIYVKKLSSLNIKKLATITEQNSTFIINSTIKSCLWGIDTDKILVADKLWLIFYLRAYTFNDLPYKLRGKCEGCGTISSFDFVLKDLNITYYENELPEYFEINGDKISVRFPTISTEAAVEKLKNDPQLVIDIDPGFLDFSSYIYKINGKEVSLMTAYEYVCELDGMSFSKFTNLVGDYMFISNPVAVFECPHCGGTVELPVPLSPSFFLPKIK